MGYAHLGLAMLDTLTVFSLFSEGVFKASMETAKDDGKAGNSNNNNNNSSSSNNNNTDTATVTMDTYHNAADINIEDDSDNSDDDFDNNDDFYLDYFADLPAEYVNGTGILEEHVQDFVLCNNGGDTDSELDAGEYDANKEDLVTLNCNNNARGAKKPTGAGKKSRTPRSPSPPPVGDPDLLPRVVTLMAYGDKGVSDPIEVDMNKADDFEVRYWNYEAFIFMCINF